MDFSGLRKSYFGNFIIEAVEIEWQVRRERCVAYKY